MRVKKLTIANAEGFRDYELGIDGIINIIQIDSDNGPYYRIEYEHRMTIILPNVPVVVDYEYN